MPNHHPGPWWICAFAHRGKGYVIRFKLGSREVHYLQFLTPIRGEDRYALTAAAFDAAERFARDNAEFISQALAA